MEDNNNNTESMASEVSPVKEDPPGSEMAPPEAKDSGGGGEETVERDVEGGGDMNSSSVETLKRKRGRPKKFDDVMLNNVSPPPGFSLSSSRSSDEKRGRGRPPGSGRLQLLASLGGYAAETAGGAFTPYVLGVNTGEDITLKITSFVKRVPLAVSVLSATGTVSCAVVRQIGISGAVVRYEGRFEILSLSGSFTFTRTNGMTRKIGNLSVSLANPEGRVYGGSVIGPLIASGPIQLIVASFKQNISKEIKLRQPTESSTRNLLENSEAGRSPGQIAGLRDDGDEEKCTTPISSVLKTSNGEESNTNTGEEHMKVLKTGNEEASNTNTGEEHKMKTVPENGDEKNVIQSPQHISDQKTSPDINESAPEI